MREAAHIVQAELIENYKYYGIKKRSEGYKSSVKALSDIIDFSAKREETLFYYVSRSIDAVELVESSSHEAEFLAVLEPFFTLARKRVYRHPVLNTLVLPDFESNEMKKTSQSNKDKKRSVDRFFLTKIGFSLGENMYGARAPLLKSLCWLLLLLRVGECLLLVCGASSRQLSDPMTLFFL